MKWMTTPRRRWTALASATLLLVCVGTALQVHSQQSAAAASAATPDTARTALTVQTTRPSTQNWPLTATANGTVTPWQEAVVGAQTGGLRVARLRAEVGDQVRAGQVLAELVSDAASVELRRLEANLASARASLAQAKGNADRARVARQGAAISDQAYNEYLNNELAAQASVDSSQAQVDAQRIVLDHTRIVAVDDGVITSRTAVLGKVVASGDEMFRMIRQGRLEWQAELDAAQLGRIQPGHSANIKLPTGGVVNGKVRAVAPHLSTSTGRGIVYVSLPASQAKAGMFASGSIELGSAPALTVPQSAVVLGDGYNYVFELGSDERVTRRGVRVGRRVGDRVEILDGLGAQARIVSSGGAFLADGDKVATATQAQAQPQTPAAASRREETPR